MEKCFNMKSYIRDAIADRLKSLDHFTGKTLESPLLSDSVVYKVGDKEYLISVKELTGAVYCDTGKSMGIFERVEALEKELANRAGITFELSNRTGHLEKGLSRVEANEQHNSIEIGRLKKRLDCIMDSMTPPPPAETPIPPADIEFLGVDFYGNLSFKCACGSTFDRKDLKSYRTAGDGASNVFCVKCGSNRGDKNLSRAVNAKAKKTKC